MSDLVNLYLRTEDYARLAPDTQRAYDRVLHRLLLVEGPSSRSAASLGQRSIQQLVDRHTGAPVAGGRPAQEAPHPVPMRHRPWVAFLAGVESLLSAMVADGMTGARHRSNCELVAQGVANTASAFFGGLPATGAIARTATNIRAGARSPVSGIMHAAFLLIFMLFAAPLMAFVPLASLAAVLVIVAWNMSEIDKFRHLLSAPIADRVVLLVTFALTVMVDLTVAIQVGVVLGAVLFMHRMAEAVIVVCVKFSKMIGPLLL